MQVGGTELNAIRTLEQLDRSRFDLRVFHLGTTGPLFARYQALGVPLHHVRLTSLFSPRLGSAALRAARQMRAARVEILHAHDVYSNIVALVAGRLANVPAIVTSRRWVESVPSRRLALGNRWTFRLSTRVLANSEAVVQALEQEDGVAPARIRVIPNFVDAAAFEPYPAAERQALLARFGIPPDALVIGSVARLVPWDPLESTCRHASLSIL